MGRVTQRALVEALLTERGRTYAAEVGIRVEKNTPSALFQLLYMSMLLSARIAAGNAVEATKALIEAGLTTPQKMADASWQDRVDIITWHGYKRYDERTSRMLGETAELVLERYRGDLRRLREEAGHEVKREKALLKEFKGIGDVGADIFLREVQSTWEEVYPFADKKVLGAAQEIGLPDDVNRLAKLVSREDFPRLVAALIRADLAKAHEEVRAAAAR